MALALPPVGAALNREKGMEKEKNTESLSKSSVSLNLTMKFLLSLHSVTYCMVIIAIKFLFLYYIFVNKFFILMPVNLKAEAQFLYFMLLKGTASMATW